jgi:hypothetical protein
MGYAGETPRDLVTTLASLMPPTARRWDGFCLRSERQGLKTPRPGTGMRSRLIGEADMLDQLPPVVSRYFQADGKRDVDAILALFARDATVLDEGETYRGINRLRAWQDGPASRWEYIVTILDARPLGNGRLRVVGRLDGNFPGGTATVNFDFELADEQIRALAIAP